MFLLSAMLHILNRDFSVPQKTNWTGFSYLDNNVTLFWSVFFPPQNKKYNSVNSSISQNMMNGQSRNILHILWNIPEELNSTCIQPFFMRSLLLQLGRRNRSRLSSGSIWPRFLLAHIVNGKVPRAKHALDFSWGQLDFNPEWCCFIWHTGVP